MATKNPMKKLLEICEDEDAKEREYKTLSKDVEALKRERDDLRKEIEALLRERAEKHDLAPEIRLGSGVLYRAYDFDTIEVTDPLALTEAIIKAGLVREGFLGAPKVTAISKAYDERGEPIPKALAKFLQPIQIPKLSITGRR